MTDGKEQPLIPEVVGQIEDQSEPLPPGYDDPDDPQPKKRTQFDGRPTSSATLRAQMFRDQLTYRFSKMSKAYFDAVQDLALGAHVAVQDPVTGKVTNVYKQLPDKYVLFGVFNQVMGAPPKAPKIPVEDPEIEIHLNLLADAMGKARKTVQGERPAGKAHQDDATDIPVDSPSESPPGPGDNADPVRQVGDSGPSGAGGRPCSA